MCGIHLLVSETPQPQALQAMLATSTHRGPDHAGEVEVQLSSYWLGLAANRLMISDRSEASHQPLAGPDGSWLVYNGEIYNAFDLRNELLSIEEVQFRSASDTEVLLWALLQWGHAVLPRLNGMFAFAFWDGRRKELVVARDRSGMKPLHWADTAEGRIIASEIKAIKASGLLKATLDTSQIPSLLANRYSASGPYVEINPLPPGHYFRWKPDFGWQQNSFIPEQVTSPIPENPLSAVQEQLTDALLAQLEAQAKVGLFLSGGVDSTLLLAIMQAEGIPRTPAFTIAHREKDSQFGTRDAYFANKAAQQYGTSLDIHTISPEDLARFPEFMDSMDSPIGDSGAFLAWLLAEKAKDQGFGVVLSGAGADELFAGYHRHKAMANYLKHYRTWLRWRPTLKTIAPLLPTGKGVPGRAKFQLLRKLALRIHPNPWVTYKQFAGLQLPAEMTTFWSEGASEFHGELPAIDDFLEYDQNQYLVHDVLALSDTFTMAHGIEMRLPYLDTNLAAWASGLPGDYRLEKGPKWLLKNLLTNLGGKAYAQRRKEGFGLPLGHWVRNGEVDGWLAILERENLVLWELLSPKTPRKWVEAQRRGKADFAQEIWNVVSLAYWLEEA